MKSLPSLSSTRSGSLAGVEALLSQLCQQHEAALTAAVTPEEREQQFLPVLTRIGKAVAAYRDSLTSPAGSFAQSLDADDEQVRALAIRFAQLPMPTAIKARWATICLGIPVPGKSLEAQAARLSDIRFWRRAIRLRLLREREALFLRQGLIGQRREMYVSDLQVTTRTQQLRQQQLWMQNTILVPRYLECGEQTDGPLTLAQVASSPKTRFAKLYAFTRAMDEIAQAEGLSASMLTLTLEPEWHPNPSHGVNSWNGASPREGHRKIAQRWQSILRDCDRAGIGLSGLRVVEPHKDACPHWHLWLLYRPEVETRLLATVMGYFPGKLKIRAPSRKSQKRHHDDRIYETCSNLLSGIGRAPTHAKEGSQVELSRIDRSISSGASYAMKYLLKTVDAGEQLNKEVDLFGKGEVEAQHEQREEHQATAQRVDAYRSLWGINAGQLFGVAKCLSAWDELRRLTQAPKHAKLRELWALARGSNKPGRIAKNAGLRGNPRAFLEALGGLAACRSSKPTEASISIERLTEAATNGYGEAIQKAKGICLVQREKVRVRKGQIDTETGEIYARHGDRSRKTVLASVVTRLTEWTLAPAKNSAQAVLAAQERAKQRDAANSPEGLGKRARQHFWSSIWEAKAALYPEERYPKPKATNKWQQQLLALWPTGDANVRLAA